jgi:hypothetical protein
MPTRFGGHLARLSGLLLCMLLHWPRAHAHFTSNGAGHCTGCATTRRINVFTMEDTCGSGTCAVCGKIEGVGNCIYKSNDRSRYNPPIINLYSRSQPNGDLMNAGIPFCTFSAGGPDECPIPPSGDYSAPADPYWIFNLGGCSGDITGFSGIRNLYCMYERIFPARNALHFGTVNFPAAGEYRAEFWFERATNKMMDQNWFSTPSNSIANKPNAYASHIHKPFRICTNSNLISLADPSSNPRLGSLASSKSCMLTYATYPATFPTTSSPTCNSRGTPSFGRRPSRQGEHSWCTDVDSRGRHITMGCRDFSVSPFVPMTYMDSAELHSQNSIGGFGTASAYYASNQFVTDVCDIEESDNRVIPENESLGTFVFSGLPHGDTCGFEGCVCTSGFVGIDCQFSKDTYCPFNVKSVLPQWNAGQNRCGLGECRYDGCNDFTKPEPFLQFDPTLLCKDVAANTSMLTTNMFCVCSSGVYGLSCDTTCRHPANPSLFGDSACLRAPANTVVDPHSKCVMVVNTDLSESAVCRCETNWFPTGANNGVTGHVPGCMTCQFPVGVDNEDCSDNGVCSQPTGPGTQPVCTCKFGWTGVGCQIRSSGSKSCGGLTSGGLLTMHFDIDEDTIPVPSDPSQEQFIKYSIQVVGQRITTNRPISKTFSIRFPCTSVSIFQTATAILLSDDDFCRVVRERCQSQWDALAKGTDSLDICPLPFVDLVPPEVFVDVGTSYRFCREGTALLGNYFTKEFTCYRLSTTLTPNTIPGGSRLWRCTNFSDDADVVVLCDIIMTTAEQLAYTSNGALLGKRLIRECANSKA